MTDIVFNSTAGRTLRVFEDVDGLRHVESLPSILRVVVGPIDKVKEFLKANASLLAYIVYLLQGPRCYIGRGTDDRRMGDRLSEAELAQMQVSYVVYSLDPRFDSELCTSVESVLIERADKNGVPLANTAKPHVSRLRDSHELVLDLCRFVRGAGFPYFDEAHPANAVNAWHAFRAIEPEQISIPPGAVLKKLICGDNFAEGFELEQQRFCVLPGAHYCFTNKSGLSDDNRDRRLEFEQQNTIEKLAGFEDRGLLRKGFNFYSAPMAAKILTGQHIGSEAWEEIPQGAPVDAGAP